MFSFLLDSFLIFFFFLFFLSIFFNHCISNFFFSEAEVVVSLVKPEFSKQFALAFHVFRTFIKYVSSPSTQF